MSSIGLVKRNGKLSMMTSFLRALPVWFVNIRKFLVVIALVVDLIIAVNGLIG